MQSVAMDHPAVLAAALAAFLVGSLWDSALPFGAHTMGGLRLTRPPIASTAMLIRRPVTEVFEAFVEPDVTTKFWFTKSSGRLEAGKQLRWEWDMYGISIPVTVKAVEPNRRIVVEWPAYGRPITVEWTFTAWDDDATFVAITSTGFAGDGDAVVKQATDSIQGFTLVLAGLKALLEHGIRLGLVADRFPKGLEEHGSAAEAKTGRREAEPLMSRYAGVAARLLDAALNQGGAARYAQHLSDRIGPRLAGSPGEKAAVAWAVDEIRSLGLEAREEPVMVPVWRRGEDSARLLSPVEHRLAIAALGGSPATPAAGVSADVVEVDSLEGLKALGASNVRGRVVLFNRMMEPGLAGYSAIVALRTAGASEAARLGAVASLVRSIGTGHGRLPHTGSVVYSPDAPAIPAAAVSAEDGELMHRLLAAGSNVRVRLRLGCTSSADVPGANVVAELRGRTHPEEIVLIGAHLDSWDLGSGAIDDAAGVGMVLDALRLLSSNGLVPRRTVRAVLFANEENGLRGGLGYAEAHASELDRHVVAIEADAGAGRPLGVSVHAGPEAAKAVVALAGLLLEQPLVREEIGGPDLEPLAGAGVPLLGLIQDESRYFDWHHTAADTFDKIDPRSLAESTAFLATLAYVLADDEATLARSSSSAEQESGSEPVSGLSQGAAGSPGTPPPEAKN